MAGKKLYKCCISAWVFVLSFLFLSLSQPIPSWAEELGIGAKAAVLIDMKSGQVLWEKNCDQPLPPASTTKIITAITALDLASLGQIYQVSSAAAAVGESSAKLRPGEKLYMMELLQGALISSGNDACYGIGEAVAGCEPLFVHWLNLKAAILGASTANWLNTNGLPQEGHVVSVRDLAQISRYAMANPCFGSIVSSQYATIGQTGNRRRLKNTNRLLFENKEIIGIKTGTTTAAGRCLVSAMEHQGMTLLCVVFNSQDRFGESLRLLRYGMDNFCPLHLVNQGELLALLPINPEGKSGCELTAVVADNDGYCLYKKNQINSLSLRWQLPSYLLQQPQNETPAGNLFLLDAEGEILTRVGLKYASLREKDESEAGFLPLTSNF